MLIFSSGKTTLLLLIESLPFNLKGTLLKCVVYNWIFIDSQLCMTLLYSPRRLYMFPTEENTLSPPDALRYIPIHTDLITDTKR